jgi:putative transposase
VTRTVHRTWERWIRIGVFPRIWSALTAACEERGGLDWTWQAADGAMGKARFGGDLIDPHPTDRGKKGVKRSLLVEANGGPLAVIIVGESAP